MPETNLFLLFTRPLDQLGVDYMVTGSVATIVYGEPRSTHDVDLVVALKEEDVVRLLEAFPESDYYRPPEEVVRVELARAQRGHFNLIHNETGFKADVYLVGDDLHRWALRRRRRVDLSGDAGLWVAPPEYVIVRKLEYYREGRSEKHLRDIRGLLETSGGDLDRDVLFEWLSRLGLLSLWDGVKED
ncbi:MAG: hypothetical protein ACE5JX_10840 [Acidobacteriota bacterium]